MTGQDVIVDRLRAVPESAPAASGAPGVVEVAFATGRTARVDTAAPAAHAWLDAMSSLQEAGLPAYVVVDADSRLVTDVLVPLSVRVVGLRTDAPDAVEVELAISQARHWLPRSSPRFDELLRRLDEAREHDAPVLVTERTDTHAIIDVRDLPADLPPPPLPSGREAAREAPELASPVSFAVASSMFALVNGRTACSSQPVAPGIPFTYPDDGCWGRAHEMSRLMALQGVVSDKVWIYGDLRVATANNPSCEVYWGWHVAPTLPVVVGSSTETYVIDPALFPSPVPRATWAGVQGDPSPTLVATGSEVFYRSPTGSITLDPTYSQTNSVLTTYRTQLLLRSASSSGPPPYPQCVVRPPGTQWFGTLGPNQTGRWFTFGWPAGSHIVWTVMPTTICPGTPQVRWKTAVERASTTQATYWITVTNLTPHTIRFEGRYDVLAA